MAKAPNEKALRAFELYKQGKKLVEIAEELGVPPGTVRRWKSTQNWDKHNDERSKKKKPNVRKEKTERSEEKAAANMLQPLMDNDTLTEQQKLFCIYFAKSLNATQSYIKAYGCSYNSALTAGPRMLGNVRVKLEIARLKKEKAMMAFLEPGDIIEQYIKIAFSDLGDFTQWGQEFEATGSYKDKKTGEEVVVGRMINTIKLKEAAEVDTTVVAEVKQGKSGTSIKLHDKMRALDWLAEHMDLATAEQRKRMELMTAQTKKLKSDIERAEGDESELSKLDKLLEGFDDQSDR